jgi:hypothetical protein
VDTEPLGAMRPNETPSGVQTFSALDFVVSCEVAILLLVLRDCVYDGQTQKSGVNLFACHARSWDPDADNEQEKRAPATKCGAILIGGQHR